MNEPKDGAMKESAEGQAAHTPLAKIDELTRALDENRGK